MDSNSLLTKLQQPPFPEHTSKKMHEKEMRQKKSEESLLPSLGHLYKLMLIIANDCLK